ncbi:hypothetical protein BR93DRAFT_63744 [Coniochaeta sp. PMI_546]|nr:hypothetical protein BR93DRAFT_63744 [Coniochaeta sp. PMI_546]
MYSAPYGFPNAVPGSGGPGPTFNGGAPPPQNPHMQPGPSPNQPQMMYSNQQFPMTAQGPFSGANNPAAMMAAAGPAAMMQNPGMPHMAPNGQSKLLLSCPSLLALLLCSPPPPLACPSIICLHILSFGFVCACFACRVSDGTTRSA